MGFRNNFNTKIAVFIVIYLSGCAKTIFVHPTKNAQDFEHDKYECQLIAEQSAANWGAQGNPFVIADKTKECLKKKYGWREQKQ